ncbi:ubiquinone anaerobic biosynthesis accessory factor UbiT [Psychromonas antarctica]|uniref:ubiquinone anaerobic biosynthesis accessory factor UbiT n=1 Tax=Psychromonas antarctica TaxID=67573 RepID=UPI001EE78A8E|nr:SCP2 sterol-binding domain-containing protein [Psychromonas antarctica]MCG6201564.1 SCP2 sterol-binding domain-containing protein [Psychromonas antarctica]
MFKSTFTTIRHQLVTNAPKVLAFPSALLPFFVQKKMLADLLGKVFSDAIEEGDLVFLQDKWLKIEITDLKLTWFLSYASDKLIIEEQCEHSDVTFSAAVNELILIAGRKEDPDTLFFQRRLSIQGDTELGLEIKNLIDNIDFDTLPASITKLIEHFSTFIQQGLIQPENNIVTA